MNNAAVGIHPLDNVQSQQSARSYNDSMISSNWGLSSINNDSQIVEDEDCDGS